MPADTFRADLDRGKTGVDRVAAYLRKQGYAVTDVSSDAAYQAKDIDLLACKSGGKPLTVEVKLDTYIDINATLTYEIVSSLNSGRPGCCLTTKADWMAFLAPQSGTLLLFQAAKMREYLSKNLNNGWQIAVRPNVHEDGHYQTSISLKIPVESAMEAVGGKVIYNLQ